MTDADNDLQDEFLDPEDRDFVIDDDLAVLSRYLGDDLTEEERRNVEVRAATDRDFWRKIGPLAGLFALDTPVDLDAFREAFDIHSDDVPVSITQGLREGRVAAPSRLERARLRARDAVGGAAKVVTYGLAAALVIFVGLEFQPTRSLATRAFTAALVHTDTAELHRVGLEAKHDMDLGLMAVDGQGPLTEDWGPPDGPKMFVFDDRSRGVVLPGSRIAFRTPTTVLGHGIQLGLLRGRPGHFAVIDGEVVFTAVARWAFQTTTARIEIDSGMVAIRRLPHGTVTQVNVGQGMAWVFPRHTQDSIAVHRGEVLMIPSTGAPRLGRDTTGFPVFGDTAHPTNPRRTP